MLASAIDSSSQGCIILIFHNEAILMNNKKIKDNLSKNAIYILPNLFTTASLMTGFSSILLALEGRYASAAVLIFISMVLDGMDGRVARWTNTQSSFGEQYDSLADMVAFGVAPAILVYMWSFQGLGEVSKVIGIGWFASFVYLACAALRLARFNVQIGSVDKRYFVGLPSPTAAAIVAGAVWAGEVGIKKIATAFGADLSYTGHDLTGLMVIITLYAGLMMVSNFLFYSFKTLEIKKVRFTALIIVVIYAGMLISSPPIVLFLTAFIYGLSAPIQYIYRRQTRKKRMLALQAKRSERHDERHES